jgi:hypothetical protein
MPQILLSDNAETTLASGINNSATALSVNAGDGAKFPTVVGGSGDYFRVTLRNASGVIERIKVTEHSAASDSFPTVVRAQEGTSAVTWNAGDSVALRPTAQILEDLLVQTNSAPNVIMTLVSTGNIKLIGYHYSQHIALYDSAGARWRLRRIPLAGVTLATGALALNEIRFVYAYWTGSAVALELSATGETPDPLTGLPCKTGDITRLLVGAVFGNASSQVDINATHWGVSSYWVRVPVTLYTVNSSTQSLVGDTTWRVAPGLTFPTVYLWGDDAVDVDVMISGQAQSAGVLIASFGIDANPIDTAYEEVSAYPYQSVSSRSSYRYSAAGLHQYIPLYYSSCVSGVTVTSNRSSIRVRFAA